MERDQEFLSRLMYGVDVSANRLEPLVSVGELLLRRDDMREEQFEPFASFSAE